VHARRIAVWLAIAAVVVGTRWRWSQLVDPQTPFVEYDTQAFRQIAELPFGLDLVTAAKPLVVPLVYRAAHNDANAIVGFQAELSFVSWTILAAALALSVRRRWLRAAVIGLGVCLVLEPTRVGLVASLMPESIHDSLLALGLAGGLAVVRLRGAPRIAAAVATGVVAAAWLFTRDTNAFIAIAAAGLAMTIWRGWRSRRACVLAGLAVAASAVVAWSTTVPHDPLPYQQGWYAGFTPRARYPLLDNLILRVVPDERDELPAALQKFPDVMGLVLAGPEQRPTQAWVVDHGAATYACWLVRHPLGRARELFHSRGQILVGDLSHYMPGGWERPTGSIGATRSLSANRWLLTLLLVASPLLLRRPRRDALCGLALCIVVSGLFGAIASYYGDAVEIPRHCYGAGQQVIAGLFIALIAWVDRFAWFRSAARPSEPRPSPGGSARDDERNGHVV
jgi:hypothetical protein